jgi:hypothetical protein
MSNANIVKLSELAPGERFTKEHSPNVVFIKAPRNWANLVWKQHTKNVWMHQSERVRRAAPDQLNPGEVPPAQSR